jgi:heptosyltransferase-2
MADTPARVVVFVPNWLGDAVMALPTVQAVRATYPHAHVTVAARPSVAAPAAMAA